MARPKDSPENGQCSLIHRRGFGKPQLRNAQRALGPNHVDVAADLAARPTCERFAVSISAPGVVKSTNVVIERRYLLVIDLWLPFDRREREQKSRCDFLQASVH